MSRFEARTFPVSGGRTVLVRNALPEDAGRLLAIARVVLEEGGYHAMRAEELTRTVDQQCERIVQFATEPGRVILVAEVQGEVVGLLELENDWRRRLAHRVTAWTSILPEWREGGVGTALARSGMAWAKEDPVVEKLSMPVLANNVRSLAMCRAMGLEEEARQVREVKVGAGEYLDVVVMTLFLGEKRAGVA